MKFDSNLHKEIWSLNTMTQTLCGNLPGKAAGVFDREELARFERIVISGCGDSICAAYATKECFEKLLKMDIDTPVCIDLARHYDVRRFGEKGSTLVILVSFSGKVSRVVEAAQRAKRFGAVTMAVTHDSESPVAQACDRILHVVPEEFDLHRTPGCRTYVASMLGLYHFAIKAAEMLGKISEEEADRYREGLLAYSADSEKSRDELEEKLYNVAVRFRDIPYFEFLSSGPEFASAWFGQAKMYEATGDFSRYENFEDWTHVDYILRKMDSGMFLFVDKRNPSLSRAIEVSQVLTRQDYRYRIFTNADPALFADPLKVIQIPTAEEFWMQPLFETVPACLFAGALADVKGTTEFCADMIDSMFPFGGSILRYSKIEEH